MKVMQEIGLGHGPATHDNVDVEGINLTQLMKLGAFVRGQGVVSLDHGAILVTRTVMLRQMLRLHKKAEQLESVEDLKDISQAMTAIGTAIGRISQIGIKSNGTIVAPPAENRPKVESWPMGTAVQAQPGSTVVINTPLAQNTQGG